MADSSLGGYNDYGQLGNGRVTDKYTPTEITSQFSLSTGDQIISVSLGVGHSTALTSSGRLFTWGHNYYGQLGDGTTTSKPTPTEITSRFSLATGDRIIQVSLGADHSTALTSSGRLFTWGRNNDSQLGDGTTTNRSTLTEITQAHYELVYSDTIVYNQSITVYLPTREGYTFNGWYIDYTLTTPYAFGTMPAVDVLLYGKWTINQYDITFIENQGTTVNDIMNQDYGTNIAYPTTSRTGYTFDGWYLDNDIFLQPFTSTTIISSDITLYAKWNINQYTITFNTDGGNSILPITQDFNTAITAPVDPIKTGYTFIGWNQDIPTQMPAKNNIITALWEINQYTITFNTDGGNNIPAMTQDFNTAITAPVDPIKTGYTFIGWNQDIPSQMPAEDITITALWEINQYTILTYVENGITYINYGKYPQTVVWNANLINALNTLTQTNSEGYYEYNGNEYAKVTATPFNSVYQFTTGTKIVSGQTYYFKVEPIKWRVISNNDGTLQLLSEYIIDRQAYHPNTNTRTIDGQTIYSNNYQHSKIRTWLNSTFYNKAFGTLDQNAILTTLVNNSAATTNSSSNPYASANTNDKIYLLSYQDVSNTSYGFVTSTGSTTTGEAQTTDYARAIGAWMSTSSSTYGNAYWWLRSPGIHNASSASNAFYVDYRGYRSSNIVSRTYLGVRPALQIR